MPTLSVSVSTASLSDTPLAESPRILRLITAEAAEALMDRIREQLLRRTSSRNYWMHAADSVSAAPQSDSHITISIPHIGVGLIWKGGEVHPTGRPSEVTGRPIRRLLIPFKDSPLRMRDISLFEYIRATPGANVRAFKSKKGSMLLADQPKGPKGPKGRSAQKMTLLGLLTERVTINPHPDVLPTQAELDETAEGAARSVLTALAAGLG